jgi:hypothetical protein
LVRVRFFESSIIIDAQRSGIDLFIINRRGRTHQEGRRRRPQRLIVLGHVGERLAEARDLFLRAIVLYAQRRRVDGARVCVDFLHGLIELGAH